MAMKTNHTHCVSCGFPLYGVLGSVICDCGVRDTKKGEMNIIEKLGITPGPLVATKNDEGFLDGHIETQSGNMVAETYCDADALLYTAAPDMLEALIDWVIEYQNHWSISDGKLNTDKHCKGDINIIQKATGKTWEELEKLKR